MKRRGILSSESGVSSPSSSSLQPLSIAEVTSVLTPLLDKASWIAYRQTCHSMHKMLKRQGCGLHTMVFHTSRLKEHDVSDPVVNIDCVLRLNPTAIHVIVDDVNHYSMVSTLVRGCMSNIRHLRIDESKLQHGFEYSDHIRGTKEYRQVIKSLMTNAISSLTKLESLRMRPCTYDDAKMYTAFEVMLSRLPNLVKLEIDLYCFKPEMAHLLQSSPIAKQLLHLCVWDNVNPHTTSDTNQDELDSRVQFLESSFPRLESLLCSFVLTRSLTSKMGANWKTIRKLSLWEPCPCPCPSPPLPQLETLFVHKCPFDTTVQWLQSHTTLREATFKNESSSWIQWKDIKTTITAPRLESLSFLNNDLNSTRFQWYMRSLDAPRLTYICVDNNPISQIPTQFGFTSLTCLSMRGCFISECQKTTDSTHSSYPNVKQIVMDSSSKFTDFKSLVSVFPNLAALALANKAATLENMQLIQELPLQSLDLQDCKDVSLNILRMACRFPLLTSLTLPLHARFS